MLSRLFIALFTTILLACEGISKAPPVNQPSEGTIVAQAPDSAKIVLDSLFKPYWIDTNLVFHSLNELIEYQNKIHFKHWELHKTFLEHNKNKYISKFQLDSTIKEHRNVLSRLILNNLKRSEKDLTHFRMLGFLFRSAPSLEDKELTDLYSTFPAMLRNSPEGKTMLHERDAFLKNKGKSLQTYTSTVLIDTLGRKVSLGDFISPKYNHYLLIFGASWCQPCRYENQLLKRRWSTIDTSNVKIIAISGDKNKQKWLTSLREDNCPWSSYLLENCFQTPLAKSLGLEYIPRNFLLNENLEIIAEQGDVNMLLKQL